MPLLFSFFCFFSTAVAAHLSNVHFFAVTLNHAGQNNAVNLQMTDSGTCDVSIFGEFVYSDHQNGVWDASKQLMRGYGQDRSRSAPVISAWATNGSEVGSPVPLLQYAASPLALYIDDDGSEPSSLLAFSIQPATLSRIDINTGLAHLLLTVPQVGYSWIAPAGAFDPASALVYQVAYIVNANGSMALTLLAMRSRAPFSFTATALTAADVSIAALISSGGVWGLTVAQAGKSLVAALQISSAEESNMLVSVDALTGAVERLGTKADEFAGASIMGSILSVGGLLFVDTLDSSETTNRLHAFNASSGTLLAAAVCPRIYNIIDFVAFQ